MKTMREIADKIELEGFDYFITSYASPDIIENDADPDAQRFQFLWYKIEGDLKEMFDLIDRAEEQEE